VRRTVLHYDLLAVSSNVVGAAQAFTSLRPRLQRVDPKLTATLDSAFGNLRTQLKPSRCSWMPSGFEPYGSLTDAQLTGSRTRCRPSSNRCRWGEQVVSDERHVRTRRRGFWARHSRHRASSLAGAATASPGHGGDDRDASGDSSARRRGGRGAVLREPRRASPSGADRVVFAAVRPHDRDVEAVKTRLDRGRRRAQMTPGTRSGPTLSWPRTFHPRHREALGLPPSQLTITVGFGPSLFDGRFGWHRGDPRHS